MYIELLEIGSDEGRELVRWHPVTGCAELAADRWLMSGGSAGSRGAHAGHVEGEGGECAGK